MADYKTNGAATTTTEKKPSKFKQSFRRYWWLHLLSFVISTLVISMILTYVVLPAVAQSDVNKATMSIDQQIVSDPTANNVRLHVVSTVRSKSLFTPTLDAFDASLFLEDTMPDIKPFGKMTIPSVHATKVSVTEVDQTMDILDQEQFKRYNVLVSREESFRLAIRGRTKLHLGALPVVTVNFNKVVDMKGLNSFKGVTVKDIKIGLLPDKDGNNMNGTLVIPNPSVMTLTIGDMIQDIYSDGKLIGNTTVKDVVLKPGINEFFMASAADQVDVIQILSKDPQKRGILSVEARARAITYKGQSLPYFEEAMKQVPVKLDLQLKDALTVAGLGGLLDPTAGLGTGGGSGDTSSPSTTAPITSPSTQASASAAPLPLRRRRS